LSEDERIPLNYQSPIPKPGVDPVARKWFLRGALIPAAGMIATLLWSDSGVQWAVQHEKTIYLYATAHGSLYRLLFLQLPVSGLVILFAILLMALIREIVLRRRRVTWWVGLVVLVAYLGIDLLVMLLRLRQNGEYWP
jgi:Ca2+/Na+ antiporter